MTRTQNDLNITSPLTAREVYQVLADVVLGKRLMMRSSVQSWNEIYHGLMPVEIDGWLTALSTSSCRSAGVRMAIIDNQRTLPPIDVSRPPHAIRERHPGRNRSTKNPP
ncbi:DUF7693 family protein [Pseudomonas weihenstephanensis]|uniref:DUF7693 family protein n=1 Tax=Pseudomonas weihenstephanensis TaxID=1608994 RepID=UPI000F785CC8